MLTIILVAAIIIFAPGLLALAIRAAWGIAKIVCSVALILLLILVLLYIGLKYIAIPLLIIVVVAVLIGRLVIT